MLELNLEELTILISLRAAQNVMQPLDSYDPLMEKLNNEYQRLTKMQEERERREAQEAQRQANVAYALTQMKVGDVVDALVTTGYGYGAKSSVRRVRVTEVEVMENKYGMPRVDFRGVVLTKSGQPHKTLNEKYSGTRKFYNVFPGVIKLVKAA
jgi:hypothetical protein